MKQIAIVTPWFGRALKGGAEQQAWQIAARLAGRGHGIEVLTTCCRSHQDDWATNHISPGLTNEPEGFRIRRFPVEPRNRNEFDRVCSYLLSLPKSSLKIGISPLNDVDAAIFSQELIKSPALLDYLKENANTYLAFIFMPYLYGPILNGLPLVAAKSYLQPCLHDEAYAYLPQVADLFRQARGILFNSEGESELAARLFGPGIIPKSIIVGEGVEVAEASQPVAPPAGTFPFGSAPYVLCLGRKGPGKNSHLLLNAFRHFKTMLPDSTLKLVYAGSGDIELNGLQGQVFDLGTVSDHEKLALLDGCRALFQPSDNESFSRVMMEAWLRGRPVAVHRHCSATATAVRQCDGGWLASYEFEWSELFADLECATPEELNAKGCEGRKYARETADWQKVMDRYEAALLPRDPSRGHPRHSLPLTPSQAVHQVLPNLTYGDAISTHARWIRQQLRNAGYASEIFARYIDPRVADECHLFTAGCIQPQDAILYHHSIASELTPHVVAHPGPKCLIYHNITPAEFFEPFRPELARLLREGREDLKVLARHFPVSVGDSEYNAYELQESGFANPGVLPICVDPAKWNLAADPALMDKLQGNGTNLLFVGRLSPQKKQEDLIRIFRRYLEFEPTARLHLVGGTDSADPYLSHLHRTADSLGLNGQVNFAGHINDAQLAAYYRTADLFWSMSEHEGFCVPLVEAMWFEIPVLAFKSTATPETLGPAGLLFTTKQDEQELAALAHVLVRDQKLRRKLLASQHGRRSQYLPAAVAPRLFSIVTAMTQNSGKP